MSYKNLSRRFEYGSDLHWFWSWGLRVWDYLEAELGVHKSSELNFLPDPEASRAMSRMGATFPTVIKQVQDALDLAKTRFEQWCQDPQRETESEVLDLWLRLSRCIEIAAESILDELDDKPSLRLRFAHTNRTSEQFAGPMKTLLEQMGTPNSYRTWLEYTQDATEWLELDPPNFHASLIELATMWCDLLLVERGDEKRFGYCLSRYWAYWRLSSGLWNETYRESLPTEKARVAIGSPPRYGHNVADATLNYFSMVNQVLENGPMAETCISDKVLVTRDVACKFYDSLRAKLSENGIGWRPAEVLSVCEEIESQVSALAVQSPKQVQHRRGAGRPLDNDDADREALMAWEDFEKRHGKGGRVLGRKVVAWIWEQHAEQGSYPNAYSYLWPEGTDAPPSMDDRERLARKIGNMKRRLKSRNL